MGDITKRRGQIREQEETGNAIKVRAFVPLAEMFGYVTDLRSFTQGSWYLFYANGSLRRST